MKYNELNTAKQKSPTRPGRGISAGRGKTAGRGTKGQGARKSPTRQGFEGGQIPLYMRLPKLRGFKSHRAIVENVYTGQLNLVKSMVVDSTALYEAGLVNSPYSRIKLLQKGEISTKKTVKLPAASKAAVEAIEKAGGSFEPVPRLSRPSKKESDKQN